MTIPVSFAACAVRKRTQAFSLVEVLVAIAVIAILAAILIPAMGGSRARTLSAVSMSNLRQSGSLLLMNAAENGNSLELKAGGSGGADKIWSVVVANMVAPGMTERITADQTRMAALDIMYCPTFYPYRHDPAEANWQWSTFGLFAIAVGNYSGSEAVTVGGSTYSLYKVNLASADNLSMHPLLLDSVQVSLNPSSQRMSIRSWTATPSAVSVHMRHNGKARAVFLDGSVRELDKDTLRDIGFRSAISSDMVVVSTAES